MRYNILQPSYTKHFDAFGNRVTDEKGSPAWRVEWRCVGQCDSMAQAKLVCAVPVLEEVKK